MYITCQVARVFFLELVLEQLLYYLHRSNQTKPLIRLTSRLLNIPCKIGETISPPAIPLPTRKTRLNAAIVQPLHARTRTQAQVPYFVHTYTATHHRAPHCLQTHPVKPPHLVPNRIAGLSSSDGVMSFTSRIIRQVDGSDGIPPSMGRRIYLFFFVTLGKA